MCSVAEIKAFIQNCFRFLKNVVMTGWTANLQRYGLSLGSQVNIVFKS